MASVGSTNTLTPMWRDSHLQLKNQEQAPVRAAATAPTDRTGSTAAAPAAQELSDTQKRGMTVIENTLKNKNLTDSQRASMLQAQQRAFGVSDAMVQNAQNKPADSTAVSAASPLQEIGMKALMGTLSQNFANSNGNGKAADKSAVEDIVKTFGLTKDMVNQVAENFAKENEDRYLFAKQQLGAMMGFNTKA